MRRVNGSLPTRGTSRVLTRTSVDEAYDDDSDDVDESIEETPEEDEEDDNAYSAGGRSTPISSIPSALDAYSRSTVSPDRLRRLLHGTVSQTFIENIVYLLIVKRVKFITEWALNKRNFS